MKTQKEIHGLCRQWMESYDGVWELIKKTEDKAVRDGLIKAAKELKVKIDMLRWVLDL